MGAFLDRFVGNISPSALLVSTFFWSWMDLVPFSPLLFTAAGSVASQAVLAVSLLVAALVLGVMASGGMRRARALEPLSFAIVALACGTGGTLLVFAGALWRMGALTYAGSVLVGVFQGIGVVVAGCLATCQGKTNALIHLAACLPANVVFVLLGMFLQPGAAVVLCAVLPLLSALSYKVFLVRGSNASLMAAAQAVPRAGDTSVPAFGPAVRHPGYVALLLLVTVAFGLVNTNMQFAGDVSFGALSDYSSLFVRAAVAAWVFCSYVFRARQPFELLVVAVAVMAVGLFALWLVPETGVGHLAAGTVFCAGYAMFDLLLWALLVILHRGARVSLLRFVCAVYALDQLGNFLGTALGMLPMSRAAFALAQGVLGACLIVLAFVLISMRSSALASLRMVVMQPEVGPAADGEACGPAASEGPVKDAVRQQATPAVDASDVRALAARFFLTEREADVLALLISGRSVPYISGQLTVSQNTVKTHVRHIYAKMDVHNRQELLDMFEGLAR